MGNPKKRISVSNRLFLINGATAVADLNPMAFSASGTSDNRIWDQGRRITLWYQFGKERTVPSCSLSFCLHAALSFILFYPC